MTAALLPITLIAGALAIGAAWLWGRKGCALAIGAVVGTLAVVLRVVGGGL